jgi:hypothetical protein
MQEPRPIVGALLLEEEAVAPAGSDRVLGSGSATSPCAHACLSIDKRTRSTCNDLTSLCFGGIGGSRGAKRRQRMLLVHVGPPGSDACEMKGSAALDS